MYLADNLLAKNTYYAFFKSSHADRLCLGGPTPMSGGITLGTATAGIPERKLFFSLFFPNNQLI